MWRLAVAASGGADSTALIAEAAAHFPPEQVIVLTVDHGTRPAASAERAHASALAAQFGFAARELTIGHAAANQAAWRKARLDALVRFCGENGIPRLWLGHHRDDSVETAALRLLADGNLASLAGISAERWDRGVAIERPLIGRPARRLRRDLMAQCLAWCEDPSNRNDRYRRVAVRRLLAAMPARPAADLVRETAAWRERRDLLVASASRLAVRMGPLGSLWLCPVALGSLPGPLAEAVLRRAALTAAGREQRIRNIDPAGALRTDEFPLSLGGARVWSLADGWLVGRDYRHIQDQVMLPAGRTVCWDARYRLSLAEGADGEPWRAARLGLRQARLLHIGLPAEWAAASLAVWRGPEFVAAPELGVWRGVAGEGLRAALAWQRLPAPNSGVFRLAPRM